MVKQTVVYLEKLKEMTIRIKFINLFFSASLFFYSSLCLKSSGQTPLNDLNWVIDSSGSDEFNTDTVNRGLWHLEDCPSGDCCNWGGGTAFERGNVSESGGSLQLRVDGPGFAPVPCNRQQYATGGVASNSAVYSYGYFEINVKLPGIYSNGSPCASKFQPGIWMAYEVVDSGCEITHNEIDLLVPGPIYDSTKGIWSGWYYQDGHCSNYNVGYMVYYTPFPLFTSFHKFGVEWNTNKIIFYLDNVPYSENYNSSTMTMHPLYLYLEEGMGDTNYAFCPGITFPQYMSVDYFRYYKLKLDCNTSSVILTNADLAAYIYSVKSDITFGNGSNSISLSNTDVKYFRAVNSITINGTFTAPLGCELGLLPTACN